MVNLIGKNKFETLMENKYNSLNIEKLDSKELEEINGGWNLLEYIAYGIGYINGTFSSAEIGNVNYDGVSGYVHNSGGNKW